MYRKISASVIALGIALLGAASAQDYYGFTSPGDNGNRYTTSTDVYGNTQVQGRNVYTGSTWRNTIESDGDQRGIDSNGNSWRYDAQSGFYSNSNGKTCFGKGALRTCN